MVLGLAWMGYTYVNLHKKEIPVAEIPPPPNPFVDFNNTLASAEPDVQIEAAIDAVKQMILMPGWVPTDFYL